MGYMNRLNHNGDAQGNFTLLARKKVEDDVGYGMYPVGTFQLNQNHSSLPVSSWYFCQWRLLRIVNKERQ